MINVFKQIKIICKQELDNNIDSVCDESSRLIDFGLDSIGLMTIIVFLEEKYNIEIDIDIIAQKTFTEITFSDVICLVQTNEEIY